MFFMNYRAILPILEEVEIKWKDKMSNCGKITADDINSLVKLFQDNKKKLKEKYGKYCINKPMSEFIIFEHRDYFNVINSIFIKFKNEFTL